MVKYRSECLLKATYAYLVAILTKIVFGRFQDGEVEFRHSFQGNVGVSFGKMVHQHPPSLEAQQALVTLVYETMIVSWRDLFR